MKTITHFMFLAFSLFALVSCNDRSSDKPFDPSSNKKQITETLENLLTSIETKNLDLLKSTMSPSGKLELILSNTETTYSVDEFVSFHEGWFKDTTWTMKTKILNMDVGAYIGAATTETIYEEPDRDGKPYMNHMIVSYVLQKEADNKWYVTKDHATTLKKSTD